MSVLVVHFNLDEYKNTEWTRNKEILDCVFMWTRMYESERIVLIDHVSFQISIEDQIKLNLVWKLNIDRYRVPFRESNLGELLMKRG